jgi:transcriptional adapter 2-alpha
MPLRQEFETEFENEAENAVKDLAFYEEDTEMEIEMKLAILKSYNCSLDRRQERKQFIFSHGLTSFKKVRKS